jgi:transposase-like protein
MEFIEVNDSWHMVYTPCSSSGLPLDATLQKRVVAHRSECFLTGYRTSAWNTEDIGKPKLTVIQQVTIAQILTEHEVTL